MGRTGSSSASPWTGVATSETSTALSWTTKSVTAGPGLDAATAPLFGDAEPSHPYNAVSAAGPTLTPAGATGPILRSRLVTTRLEGLGRLECLCSDLRWLLVQRRGLLRQAGEQVSVVTVLPPLPAGTVSVDVDFPGTGRLTRVGAVSSSVADLLAGQPVPGEVGRWTVAPYDGWSVDDWPTPLPQLKQLADFTATVDTLVR